MKSLSKCPTLYDPMDYSLPGSSVHGIFQARVLEWVTIAFSGEIIPHSHLDGYLKKKKNPENNKCWRGCKDLEPFLDCWKERKIVQLLGKT